MEIGVDRHIVAVPRRRCEQGVELDELDRLLIGLAMLQLGDRIEDLLVAVACELGRNLRLLLHEGKVAAVLDDLQVVP